MESSFDEHLCCPICLEIPEEEIYQCTEGHTICQKCDSELTRRKCPQCARPFGKNKIRNRAMESLIQELPIDCPNDQYGCQSKMKRKEAKGHLLNHCKFSPTPICEMYGYRCGFKTPLSNITTILAHFLKEHEILTRTSPHVLVYLDQFGGVSDVEGVKWSPIVLNLHEEDGSPVFVFRAKLWAEEDAVGFAFFSLKEPAIVAAKGYSAWVHVNSPSLEMPTLKWSAPIAGRVTRFKFPLDVLKKHYMADDKLQITAGVVRNGDYDSFEAINRRALRSTPCYVFPM